MHTLTLTQLWHFISEKVLWEEGKTFAMGGVTEFFYGCETLQRWWNKGNWIISSNIEQTMHNGFVLNRSLRKEVPFGRYDLRSLKKYWKFLLENPGRVLHKWKVWLYLNYFWLRHEYKCWHKCSQIENVKRFLLSNIRSWIFANLHVKNARLLDLYMILSLK